MNKLKRKSTCEDKLKEEIVQNTKDIHQKYKRLKLAQTQQLEDVNRTLKPIIEPLKKLVRIKKKIEEPEDQNVPSVTDSEEEQEEDVELNLEASKKYFSTPKGYKSAQQRARAVGVYAAKYVLYLLQPNKENELDKTFGIRADSSGWILGNSKIKISDDKIYIDDEVYQGTPGLFELLFIKKPDKNLYNKKDLLVYKQMLEQTSAHKQGYSLERQLNSSRNKKYIEIIKPLFTKQFRGKGMNANKSIYEYWDDPNELVDRLRLLLSSQSAGHNNHQNEIESILEELREANIIE
jgi:hypothetical protein